MMKERRGFIIYSLNMGGGIVFEDMLYDTGTGKTCCAC
jgi:hypothetical protein